MTAAVKPTAASRGRRAASRRRVRRLARYRDARGAPREILSRPVFDGALLVIDCAAGSYLDPRLVGRIESEESPENATLLARLYSDAGHPPCRRLRRSDLQLTPTMPPPAVDWITHEPLIDSHGVSFRLRDLPLVGQSRVSELRWTRTTVGAHGCEAVALREVIGSLESYESAWALSEAALAERFGKPGHRTGKLAAELARLTSSSTVLNRGLREAVQRAIATGETSLSSIALRCGRVKCDRRGKVSGETSWLARRIGLAPDSPGCPPTPWVHTGVLALIARRGLGLAPRETELG